MGYDFAPAMIDAARANYPQKHFGIADARELPFDDCSLDVVSCAFGLSHIENPQAAIDEAFRILKPGGQFTFTLWFGPDDGADLTAIGRDAIALYAEAGIRIPDSWTQLRFANEVACESAVKQAGFDSHQFRRLPIIMESTSTQVALDMMDKLSIRFKMILDRQTLRTKQYIRKYILSETETLRKNGVITIRWPALLTAARKPS
jgi:SAM-dependent methyltransferase